MSCPRRPRLALRPHPLMHRRPPTWTIGLMSPHLRLAALRLNPSRPTSLSMIAPAGPVLEALHSLGLLLFRRSSSTRGPALNSVTSTSTSATALPVSPPPSFPASSATSLSPALRPLATGLSMVFSSESRIRPTLPPRTKSSFPSLSSPGLYMRTMTLLDIKGPSAPCVSSHVFTIGPA